MPRYIGTEMSRVDGVAKVTGKAKYAAEFRVPNLAATLRRRCGTRR
jgi:xanthine dehydrogenase YagR molybdenum-binding subunit